MYPLVSVIIPFYNRLNYLRNAIKSVKIQTYQNYEIILKWNRSLRFALAVCTLKNSIKNEF
mgnify:CR=1 FL=1